MDHFTAIMLGLQSRDFPFKIFDWDKAARRILETGASSASAGLSRDWKCTGGQIFKNGAPLKEEETYVYLASTWATPELMLNGEKEPCFFYENEDERGKIWGAKTYWPESALAILRGKEG